MYRAGYGQGMPVTDWCEVDLINCTKLRNENISCVQFDPTQELVWIGNDSGRVQSHHPHGFAVHSAFYAQPNSDIRAIQPLANSILTLGQEGFRFHSKGGVLQYASSHPSLYGLSCMQYNHTTNQITCSGGPRSMLCNFDLQSFAITEEREYLDLSGALITLMKRSPRRLCCGLSNGMINIYDPRSLEKIHSYQSHQHGIFDMDIKGETVVTCGPSYMYDQLMADTQIKVFDLRMNQHLSPIQIKSGAFMLKFHPKLSSTLIVVSQGFFQLCDTQAGTFGIPRCFQLNTQGLSCFDISSSGDMLCFANDMGEIRHWLQKPTATVNDFSTSIEEASVPKASPIQVKDDTPLNMLAEPVEKGTKYLSDWDDENFQVNLIPAPINPKLFPNISPFQKKPQSIPNRTNHPRNQSLVENQRYTKALLAKAKSSSTFTSAKEMRRPPKKYRKCLLPSKLADNGIDSYNRTLFSGLDNTFSDCYVNSVVQMLFYCPPIREQLLHHICTKEYCLSCELGFLFYSLERVECKIAPNSNLLRTLRHIPDAGRRNFLQYRTKLSPYSSLLSDSLDFLLDQLRRELSLNIEHPLDGIIENPVNAIDNTFLSSFTKYTKCQYCNSPYSFMQQRGTFKFQYPFGGDVSSSFVELLYHSMCHELNEDVRCKQCDRVHMMRTSSRPRELSPVIVIHANIQTNNQLTPWIPTETRNFVPQHLQFEMDDDKFSVTEVEDAEQIKNESVYKLVGVLCQIIDNKTPPYASPNHFVAHVNVPKIYARKFLDETHEGEPIQMEGSGWFLFNDFTISPESADDVLKFAPWKIPAVLVYQRQANIHAYTNSQPALDVKIPEKIFLLKNPLDKSRLHPLKESNTFQSVDELPGHGDLVPIDTEFVSLSPPQKHTRSDGRVIELKPNRSCLARVSALVCDRNDNTKWKNLLDEYIVTREPVADYLTRFSGIVAGDLNPTTSKFPVVTLKSMYMKLRIMVDRGCIFVGHGLRKDFWICNLFVPGSQIRDTVDLFKLPYQRMISLRFLAHYLLDINIQGVTHDSIEDAETALRLYLKYNELNSEGSFQETLKQLYDKGNASKWKLPTDTREQSDTFPFE